MRRAYWIIALFVVSLLCSCEKNKDNKVVTPEMAKDTLYYIMNDWYFWADDMPRVDRRAYDNPYDLLEAMRYRELDKWSFVDDYESFMSDMQGDFFGHGISTGLDTEGNARIAIIYNKSPLYARGVRRGWIVKSINGYDIATVIRQNDNDSYNRAFGPSSAEFVFEKPDGTTVTINSSKAAFTANTVLHYDTIHLSSGITGHIVFESFIESSKEELIEAFDFFKKNNVTDLILDLRYNGGGYLDVAQTLASYIIGNGFTTNTFTKLRYRDIRSRYNVINYFVDTDYPLNLSKVVIISSRSTASASEAVINGLEPFINVVQVGDTTYGKPMGMDGWQCGFKYIFYPVTFKLVNANDLGEYYEGLPPEILANDDITHDFGDREENCLSKAINYLETLKIPSNDAKGYFRSPLFSEKPDYLNNMFTNID